MHYTQELASYSAELFEQMVRPLGFKSHSARIENQGLIIEYASSNFALIVVNRYRELNEVLQKTNEAERGVALFNLLDYFSEDKGTAVRANYFRSEKDILISYKKQLLHILTALSRNFEAVDDFFKDAVYEQNLAALDVYWRSKHPEFYR